MTKSVKNHDSILSTYSARVENAIQKSFHLIGPNSPLLKACQYALSTGGKRQRPCIALMMSDSLGKGGDATFAALGVEFFHTASLVADDLPSMDDDDERRSLPSVHKKFGEAAALLVSYALISAGYDFIAKNSDVIKHQEVGFSGTAAERCQLALENASFNTGLFGATGGQYLDIAPPDLSVETLKTVIHQKTSSLFEIAFVYGWLFGGGDLDRLPLVKKVAAHYGLAFQIADDLGDMEQDVVNGRKINMANVFGKEAALKMFHGELDSFLLKIKELDVDDSCFRALASSLRDSV